MTRTASHRRAIELLGLVGIADADRRLKQYPHQLSGGMRQRIMIAIAIACDPKLIIADEPTTALDVTIQAQILELMKELTRRLNVALIIITHNLGVVARYANRVNVMYAGRLVESGPAADVYHNPRHPYTMALLRSVPRLDRPRQERLDPVDGQPPDLTRLDAGCAFRPRCRFAVEACAGATPAAGTGWHCGTSSPPASRATSSAAKPERRHERGGEARPLLEVKGLRMHFPVTEGVMARRLVGEVKAVDGIDFTVRRGETLGLVGESGCGKTTTGRCILRLERPTAGEILYDGVDIAKMERKELLALRRRIQVIFQDPYSSLNPRMKVGDILSEPMKVHGIERDAATPVGEGARAAVGLRVASTLRRPLPARNVRRPAPARRHCARAGVGSGIHRLRRGGVRAGCVDPGAGGESAGGSARAVRPDVSVHRT